MVGIISKRLNFNISDKGIEKIFEFNSRNHYIKITNNLITALKILGFKNTKDYKNIKELKDIVEEKEKIMNEKKKVTLYNGTWIMSRFPEIKGEKLGRVLSHLKNKFKDNLDNQNDQTIMNEIKASLRF